MDFEIRQVFPHERPQLEEMLCSRWNDKLVVVHDTIYYPAQLPALVAIDGRVIIGIVTYVIHGATCEIVSLDSFREGMGVGSALVGAVRQKASQKGCERLWLVTTNDNLHSLGFYQKRGFHLVKILGWQWIDRAGSNPPYHCLESMAFLSATKLNLKLSWNKKIAHRTGNVSISILGSLQRTNDQS
jgi:ribosomal protein S18 acetylase RimI-like enzyme